MADDDDPPGDPGSILYVGPESNFRRYAVVRLRNDGYSIHVSDDAAIGGTMLVRDRPDIIVLDQQGIPGWANAVRILRGTDRLIPILVLVQHGETGPAGRIIPSQTETLSLHRVPIQHDQLLRTIADLVRAARTQRTLARKSGIYSVRVAHMVAEDGK